jgi:hypothetical protein
MNKMSIPHKTTLHIKSSLLESVIQQIKANRA